MVDDHSITLTQESALNSFQTFARLAALGLALTAGHAIAQSNIIDATYGLGAGSFELGAFVANSEGYMALAPGSNTIIGWTVGGPGDGVDWLSSAVYRSDTGVRSVDLQHLSKSSISTTIPTISGMTYALSFGAAAITGADSTGTVTAGSFSQAFTAPFSDSYSTQVFGRFSMQFIATGASTTITFLATGPVLPICSALVRCYGPIIDSVVVQSIPEPNAGFMLFGGLGLVLMCYRNQKTQGAAARDA
jgi:hypothetical protein